MDESNYIEVKIRLRKDLFEKLNHILEMGNNMAREEILETQFNTYIEQVLDQIDAKIKHYLKTGEQPSKSIIPTNLN